MFFFLSITNPFSKFMKLLYILESLIFFNYYMAIHIFDPPPQHPQGVANTIIYIFVVRFYDKLVMWFHYEWKKKLANNFPTNDRISWLFLFKCPDSIPFSHVYMNYSLSCDADVQTTRQRNTILFISSLFLFLFF